jgi:hypothetical protein
MWQPTRCSNITKAIYKFKEKQHWAKPAVNASVYMVPSRLHKEATPPVITPAIKRKDWSVWRRQILRFKNSKKGLKLGGPDACCCNTAASYCYPKAGISEKSKKHDSPAGTLRLKLTEIVVETWIFGPPTPACNQAKSYFSTANQAKLPERQALVWFWDRLVVMTSTDQSNKECIAIPTHIATLVYILQNYVLNWRR